MNVNRKVGNGFEKSLCEYLSNKGFWAHNLAQNAQGQPFDVLASRNRETHPIDCKVCENDVFRLNRIEENQRSAMTLWEATGNGTGWFALKLKDGDVYFISLYTLNNLAAKGVKQLNERDIRMMCISLDAWVSLCK